MTALPAGLTVAAYQPDMAEDWDRVVADSAGGTLLHSRRFLDYHGNRFKELSTVLCDGDGKLYGVFPIAGAPHALDRAISHAGSSFGGIVAPGFELSIRWRLLKATAERLLAAGIRRLHYKTTPSVCLRAPDDALMPMLLRCGTVIGCDLWPVIALDSGHVPRSLWRREIRRGDHKSLVLAPVSGAADWLEFHGILEQRLRAKFGVRPAHTPEELLALEHRLGEQQIGILVRTPNGAAVAALWFLDYGTGMLHMQYSTTTEEGLLLGAAPYAIAKTLEMASARGFRHMSLGRSTNADGWSVNHSLLRFKQKFGATLAAQFHIDVDLGECVRQPDDFLMREA